MIKHFDSLVAAQDDLTEHGFTAMQKKPFLWVKPGFMASIHPVPGTRIVVMVAYSEVTNG